VRPWTIAFGSKSQKSAVAATIAAGYPPETRLQPVPECSAGPGTRPDHELDLGMKNLVVFKLPQAFADF
jgi:hypothetical protein